MNGWLDDVARLCAGLAAKRGETIEPPTLDGAVADELLELAKVAAHTAERRFAPLTTYMVGRATASLSPTQAAGFIQDLRRALEASARPKQPGGQATV